MAIVAWFGQPGASEVYLGPLKVSQVPVSDTWGVLNLLPMRLKVQVHGSINMNLFLSRTPFCFENIWAT